MKKIVFFIMFLFAFLLISCSNSDKIELSFNTNQVTVTAGDTYELKFTTNGDSSKIVWESADKTIAIVSNGTIVGVSEGNTVIYASLGNVTAICKVEVEAKLSNYEFAFKKLSQRCKDICNSVVNDDGEYRVTLEKVSSNETVYLSYSPIDSLICLVDRYELSTGIVLVVVEIHSEDVGYFSGCATETMSGSYGYYYIYPSFNSSSSITLYKKYFKYEDIETSFKSATVNTIDSMLKILNTSMKKDLGISLSYFGMTYYK